MMNLKVIVERGNLGKLFASGAPSLEINFAAAPLTFRGWLLAKLSAGSREGILMSFCHFLFTGDSTCVLLGQ